jgi:hypothetical protein
MGPPNLTWQQIIQQAGASPDILKQQDVIRNVQNILQTNVSVCQVCKGYLRYPNPLYLSVPPNVR